MINYEKEKYELFEILWDRQEGRLKNSYTINQWTYESWGKEETLVIVLFDKLHQKRNKKGN